MHPDDRTQLLGELPGQATQRLLNLLSPDDLKEARWLLGYPEASVGWLLTLVFMNIFSGAGIAAFEDTIAAVVSLVFFLPLLIDSGGNAGSQSATLMVRALATGDVQ
jgi:magnesium transporter